jgi:hypothetical protein
MKVALAELESLRKTSIETMWNNELMQLDF